MANTQAKRITAFLSVVAMLFSMLLYFPSGIFRIDFGIKASAATITPSQPSGEGTSDSPYQIRTAAELYWFAGLVNGTLTDGTAQNTAANAVLTKDITVNSNLLSSLTYASDGNVSNGTDFTSWTPIGINLSNSYTGTFDGQGHTISGLYFNDASTKYVGLFGCIYGSGAIKNVGVVDSYFKGSVSVGGVCGENYQGTITSCYNTGTVSGTGTIGGVCGDNYLATITNCYNTGAVSGSKIVGGVCGNNGNAITNCYNTGAISGSKNVGGVCGYNGGAITNCYNTGTVSGTGKVGGVCGYNCADITNCYFDSDQYSGNAVGEKSYTSTATDVEGKTTAQFNKGEVAYLLSQGCTVDSTTFDGSVWGQTIGTDNYPVLGGAKVYATTGCVTYNNDGNTDAKEHNFTSFTADTHSCIDCGFTESHDFGEDNVCTVCNTYVISTADQLYWFAGLVNGTLEGVTQDTSANAVLTADITVNTGDVANCGGVKAVGWTDWTPIGNSNNYTGTFDGQGHTISGLYFNDASSYYVGLFGQINGTVKNVGVVDSYFNGKLYVGGVCGNNYIGTITNCYNTGTVSGSGSVGGVCGYNSKTITNCYNTGTVSATGDYTGGVCGNNFLGTITNCYNTGTVSGTDRVGGVCGYNHSVTSSSTAKITNCYNTGTVSGTNDYIGGVCGRNTSTITNCYYNSDKYSGNAVGGAGTATDVEGKTTAQFNSGEVAYLLNGSTSEGTLAWGQDLRIADSYPVLDSTKTVYQVDSYAGCKENPGMASTGYSNTNAPIYAKHSMTAHSANAATCTAAGNYAYWTCSYENGVYYKDEAGTDTFANLAATVIPAHGHDMTAHPANDATCTEPGNYAYWTCSREDGVYYKDEAGTDTFENLAATVIQALDHDYTSGGICKSCDALENGKDGFKSVSLTLTDGVILNYYLLLSEEALTDVDAYIHFTSANGIDVQILLSEGTEDNGKYKFSLALRPDQMAEVITAKVVYSDGSEGNCINYSVQQYAENVAESDISKVLVDAMLRYGAYTQLYTGKNTDNLAVPVGDYTINASIDDTYQYQLDSNASGISVKGATLQIGAYTTIRLKFQLAEGADISDYTFKCGETVLEPEKSGDFYYVYLRNIRPQDLDEMYSFTVSDGTNTTTFAYSAFTYMKNVLDNAESYDQTLVNLINAMYDYHQAAEAYLIG